MVETVTTKKTVMTWTNDSKMEIAQLCANNDIFGLISKLEEILPNFDTST
jgi:hypothetical protein